MTVQEKKMVMSTIRKASANDLLNAFKHYHDNFNPIDYDMCEIYFMLRDEVLRRLKIADREEFGGSRTSPRYNGR